MDTLDPSDWTKILNSLDNLNYIIACTQGLPISQGPTAVKKSLCTVRPCIHHMTSIAARFQNFRDFFPLYPDWDRYGRVRYKLYFTRVGQSAVRLVSRGAQSRPFGAQNENKHVSNTHFEKQWTSSTFKRRN